MIMNKQMQISVIKRAIRAKGIDTDLINLSDYVDGRLSLDENKNDIMQTIHLIVPMAKRNRDMPTRSVKKYENYEKAEKLHSQRKLRERRRDEVSTARQSFDVADLTKINLKKWKKNKRRYDINGIDNFRQPY